MGSNPSVRATFKQKFNNSGDMNFLLLLAIIYFSGVITNVLAIKIFNKFSPNSFTPSDVALVWLSWVCWLTALVLGLGALFEWLNDKFKNWLFK